MKPISTFDVDDAAHVGDRRGGRRVDVRQRGAALLTAMIIVALVATLASSMVWQQWRAVEVETADRARAQSAWILSGALDWARLIMREDKRDVDHLGEPWAVPLAEARMSTFLAADKDNTDTGPEAFLSGVIADAQSRYNLRNLISPTTRIAPPAQLAILVKLCDLVGVSGDVATSIAVGLNDAWPASSVGTAIPNVAPGAAAAAAASAAVATKPQSANPPVMPQNERELKWLGIDPDGLSRLLPYIVLLPTSTPVNLNTASREVIAAVVDTLDVAGAERLVQGRTRSPFRSTADASKLLSGTVVLDTSRVDIKSNYFEVGGRLRLDDRILEERSLIVRAQTGNTITAIARERTNSQQSMANSSTLPSQ
ncbi:MAG: ral secretion pathway protein GspK [Rhizobacter sp.]|nr:ral secretion pathway protein GspK [Rhizobacter sp.]